VQGVSVADGKAVEVDSRQLELSALSLLAALGCSVAWTLDQNFIVAIFAAESAAALVAAISRFR
jgi:hypothetical protein